MIKSLFRQMWNQRHANVWVWVELIVVLILLWYSIDLVYNYEAAARQTKGYDTENVFDIQLNLKSATPFPKCYLHKEKWTFDS